MMNTGMNDAQLDSAMDHDSRWITVVVRGSNADGTFFYSVSTTGVYCRPACPSRLALSEHVRFHASCEDAEKAGRVEKFNRKY